MKKYVVVAIDEMKIKESLAYEKKSAHIIEFLNIGDVENQLSQLEQRYGSTNVHVQHPAIAMNMLVLMVRGIYSLKWSIHMPIFPQGVSWQQPSRVLCGKAPNALNFLVSKFWQ